MLENFCGGFLLVRIGFLRESRDLTKIENKYTNPKNVFDFDELVQRFYAPEIDALIFFLHRNITARCFLIIFRKQESLPLLEEMSVWIHLKYMQKLKTKLSIQLIQNGQIITFLLYLFLSFATGLIGIYLGTLMFKHL